jgi:hypothetical protein
MQTDRWGTVARMNPTDPQHPSRPVDPEGVPPEEGVSAADASERVDLDPEEQRNWTEEHAHGEQRPHER